MGNLIDCSVIGRILNYFNIMTNLFCSSRCLRSSSVSSLFGEPGDLPNKGFVVDLSEANENRLTFQVNSN